MTLKDIFGVRMFQQGLKFLQSVADSEGYSELYDTLASAYEDNYLYKTAETMMDNLKGDVTILKSATEALGISIYKTFSDEASNKVERFTKYVNIFFKTFNSIWCMFMEIIAQHHRIDPGIQQVSGVKGSLIQCATGLMLEPGCSFWQLGIHQGERLYYV